MKRVFGNLLLLIITLLLPATSWAAVTYISDADATVDTASTTIVYTSFAVSGTNPVIVVLISLQDTIDTVTSVVPSAGLSAGTAIECGNVRNSDNFLSIWALPAPSGTGTITVTIGGNDQHESNAILMAGADQTTPCVIGDAASTSGATNPLTVTPSNLTANDAAVGLGANISAGDAPSWSTGVQTFNNNSSTINMAAGYHLGTGSVSVTWGAADAIDTMLAVRIIAAAGISGPPIGTLNLLGVGR